jgi:hypothetical protein
MPEHNYDPEKYWSEVGERIESRREDHLDKIFHADKDVARLEFVRK